MGLFLCCVNSARANLVISIQDWWNTWSDAGNEAWAGEGSNTNGIAFYGWNYGGGGTFARVDIEDSETNLVYYFRMRMLKEAQFADTDIEMKLEFYQSDGATGVTQVTNKFNSSTMSTSWDTYSMSADAPASAVLGKVRPVVAWNGRSPQASGSRAMKLDNAMVYDKTKVYPIGNTVEEFAYDPDYGDEINGKNLGGGWSAAWSGTDGQFEADDGSFGAMTGYPTPRGNKLKFTPPSNNGLSISRNFNAYTNGRIYVAYMMNYQYSGSGKWLGVELLSNGVTKAFAGEVSGGDQRLGLASFGGTDVTSSYVLTAGSSYDYLVILSYDFSTRNLRTKAYYKTASVPSAEPTTWDASTTVSAGRINLVDGIRITGGASSGTPGDCYIDEIRIAHSWKELLNTVEATWDGMGTSGDWGNPSNWVGNVVPATTADVTFYDSIYSGTNINLSGNRTVNSLTFSSDADSAVNLRSNTLTIVSGIEVDPGAGAEHRISSAVALGAAQTWSNGSSSAFTVAGAVSGSYPMYKDGNGRLNLCGANTYSGVTELRGGQLAVGADNNLGTAPGSYDDDRFRVIGDWPSLWVTNSFTMDVRRGITLQNNLNIEVDGANTLTYAGIIQQSSTAKSIAKRGTGELILNGTNTFTGNIYIDNGTVELGGSDPVSVAYLDVGPTSGSDASRLFLKNSVTIDSPIHFRTGSSGKEYFGMRETGTAVVENEIEISEDLVVTNAAGSILSVSKIWQTSPNTVLRKEGEGTLVLYSNSVAHITNELGVVRLGCDDGWTGDWLHINLHSTATFDLNSYSGSVACVDGSGSVTLGGGTLNIAEGWNAEFSGVISENGDFRKGGGSEFTLSGANTFNGRVFVDAGTLNVSDDGNLGAVPGSVDADQITLSSWSTLKATDSFTMDSRRGITLDQGSGARINVATSQTLVYDGIIAGARQLAKDGLGTLQLGGNSIFSGNMWLDAGTIDVRGSDPMDAVSISLGYISGSSPATLRIGSSSVLWDVPIYVRGGSSGTKSITAGYSSGTAEITASLVDMRDNLTVTANSGGNLTFAATASIDMSASLTSYDLYFPGADDVTINGSISAQDGACDVYVNGTGALILNGDNATSVDNQMRFQITGGGEVQVQSKNALGDAPTGAYPDKINFSSSGGSLHCTQSINFDQGANQWGVVIASGVTGNLDVDASKQITLPGVISGSGGILHKSGDGYLVLTGTSTYSGATVINAGCMDVRGSISSSSGLTMDTSAELRGSGSVPGITVSGAVNPGENTYGVGTLTAASAVLPVNGIMHVDFGDVDGSAGTDWDLLDASAGVVTVSSVSGQEFVIELHDTNISNWDSTQDYTWTIMQGASVSGFNSSDFTVDATDWPTYTGVFSVQQTGAHVELVYTSAAPDPPTDCYVVPDGPESMNAYWTRQTDAGLVTLVVRRHGAVPTVPVNGVDYTNLQEYGSSTKVIYKGTAETELDVQLLSDQEYQYAFYTCRDADDLYSSAGTVKSGESMIETTEPFYAQGEVESFTYYSGDIVDQEGGTNWAGAWSHQQGTVTMDLSSSLATLPCYPPAYGGRVWMDPGTSESRIRRAIDPIGTGVLYIAYTFTFTTETANKYVGFTLFEDDVEKMYFGNTGYSSLLGLQYVTQPEAYHTSNSVFGVFANTTYTVIGKLDFDNSKAYIKGYYYETIPGAEPTSWDVDTTFEPDHIGAVNYVNLKCGGLSGGDPGNVYYDEIHMSTNWQGLVQSTNMPVWVGEDSPLRAFSRADNWYPPYAPQEYMNLVFGDITAAARAEVTNDYGAYMPFRQLWFTENNYSMRVRGNAIKVREKVENASTNSHEIETDMSFYGGGGAEVNPVNGDLTIDGIVYVDSNIALRVWGDNQKTLTFEHSIAEGLGSGAGASFEVKGDSRVVFESANTYKGSTTIERGELVVDDDLCLGAVPAGETADQLNIGMGGRLTFDIGSSKTLSANRGVTLTSGGGEISVEASTLTVASAVHGTDPLTKEGAGTLLLDNTLNDYTGATLVSNGVLEIVTDDSLGDPPGSATDGHLTLDNGELDLKTGAGSVSLDINRNVAVQGTGVVFDVVSSETLRVAGAVKGSADIIKEGAGDLWVTNKSNAMTGKSHILSGRFIFGQDTMGTGDVYIDDSANWYLAAGTEVFDAAHRVYLSGTAYTEVGAGSTLQENGVIAGAGSLNKQGEGQLQLYGVNTYSGGTVINGGTLYIDSDSSLGDSSGDIAINNGKYLKAISSTYLNAARDLTIGEDGAELVCDFGVTLSVPGVISGDGMLIRSGAGELHLSGNNTYTNRTIVEQGTLAIGADSNLGLPPATTQYGLLWFELNDWSVLSVTSSFTLHQNRGINLQNVNLNLDVASGETLIYDGVIDGPSNYGSVSKREAGRLVLGGQNQFTNVLYINGGAVKVTDTTDPLDVGWIDIGDDSSGTSPEAELILGAGVTIDNQIHIRTNVGAVVTGDRRIKMEDAGTAEVTQSVRMSDLLVVDTVAGSTLTFSSGIWQNSGEGQDQLFSKEGDGSVVFGSAGNTFKWLNVLAGVGRSGVDNALASYCDVRLYETLYDMDDHDLMVQTVAGSGTVDLGAGTLSIYKGYNMTSVVEITGTGGFTKTGAEDGEKWDYTLLSTNDYTGLTKVCHGTLRIFAPTNIGSGNIMIESNATLRCEESMTLDISRDIEVNLNGQIASVTGKTLVVDGVISGNTMSFYGDGGMTLNNENTFSGVFYINEGTVSVTAADPFACSRIEFGPEDAEWDVTLDLSAGTTIDVPLTVNYNAQLGRLKLIRNSSGGVANFTGEIRVEDSVQLVFENGAGGTLNIHDIDNDGTKTYLWVGGGHSVNLVGNLYNDGGAGIDKQGGGAIIMTNESTFNGGFYVVGGTAVLGNLSGQTLSECPAVYLGESGSPFNSTLSIAGGVDVTNRIESRWDANGTVINTISKYSAGDSELSGELTIAYGNTPNNTFRIDNSAGGEMTFTGPWNLNSDQRGVQVTGDIRVTGAITNGTGGEFDGLVKRGEGTMELNGMLGVNFYQDQGNVVIGSGCTFVDVDTYYLGTRDNEDYDDADTYLTFEEAQTFTNGITVGTLGVPTGIRQINFENAEGTVEISGAIDLCTNANRFLIISNDVANAVLSGNISGTGGLIKQGAGTVRFSANATYADQTKVEEGVLLLDNIDNTASMSVSNAGVLAGQGTVGAIDNYGALGPALDAAPGTLECSSLQFRHDSQFNCAISASANDLLDVNGDVTFGGTVVLNITNIGNGSLFQDMTVIDYTGSSIGSPTWVITGDVTLAMAQYVTVTNNEQGKYWYIKGANPECNITNGAPDVAADNKVEIEVETVEGLAYDLIYVDAINYSDSLSNSWKFADRLVATSSSTTFTNDLSSLIPYYLRFLRVSPQGAWSNSVGRFASEQVYVAKRVQLYEGRNWVSLPCSPACATVSNVFGYRLHSGASSLMGTAIYLYDTGERIAPTSMIWLSSENHWMWETGGVDHADNFVMPTEQGFVVDTPLSRGSSEFAVVGALRTNSSSVLIKGDDTLNFLSVVLPRQMHPSNLNLTAAGFATARRPMRGDRLYIWDGANQRLKSSGWLWCKQSDGKWYYDNGTAVSDSSRLIHQTDAILIYTAPGSSDWTWTNSIYYTPPTKDMAP